MHERDLLLVGGGHTHALAIRSFAMRPIPDVRITLVSDQTLTPYSGMLPGYVAGHYTFTETHIDLNRLCLWAGIRFIRGQVTSLDLDDHFATVSAPDLTSTINIAYDAVSLDIGSTPDLSVPGAARYATGVKPVSGFAATWNDLLQKSAQADSADWGVIGAGAGGVELVLAMAHRIKRLQYHLLYPGDHVLKGYPARLVKIVERQLRDHGIRLHPGFRVEQVNAGGVISSHGQTLSLDQSIWCTGASAAPWLKASGLTTSEQGFVAVDETLRSVSHSNVFAAGDCADMLHDPRPKAGVYAVRQAPFLVHNLSAHFTRKRTRTVKLQKDFLSLISLGEKRAVGCRAGLVVEGKWVWRWKDSIDRKFMRRLNDPKPRNMPLVSPDADAPMHCAGCGSKVGPDLLADSLAGLPRFRNDAVIAATHRSEDASLWRVSAGKLAVQSIDGFRSFSRDDWRFGYICVNHALSDLYAMGATPVCAQVWINLAFAHPRLQLRDHKLLMSGIAAALKDHQVALAGGHSTEGAECHVGIVANGEVCADRVWSKAALREGDVLLLSKALGTGVVLAAEMQRCAPVGAVEAAYRSMLTSNKSVAARLAGCSPGAVTDVTGFGLLGHLWEMLDASEGLGASINVAAVPCLDGALALAEKQIRSSLFPQLQPLLHHCDIANNVDRSRVDLLLDPQTSGGFLFALPAVDADDYLKNYPEDTWRIGEVIASEKRIALV